MIERAWKERHIMMGIKRDINYSIILMAVSAVDEKPSTGGLILLFPNILNLICDPSGVAAARKP